MYKINLTSGQSFECSEFSTILDAAQSAYLNLPYSCKIGRCSSCKIRVLNGQTYPIREELSLTSAEKQDGWVLSCIRKLHSDLQVEAGIIDNIAFPDVKTLPVKVDQISKLNNTVLKVVLRFPPTSEFNFIPGQYINVIGPNGIKRSYSIANGNFLSRQLELQIKMVSNGLMSRYWFYSANQNDLLRIEGPLGTFILRNTHDKDLVFLATGTGIAPIKAQVEYLHKLPDHDQPRSVTVFWGSRYEEDIYLDKSAFQNVDEYFPVLSRPRPKWEGSRGFVQDVFLSKNPNLDNCLVYACGSARMIDAARTSLIKAGLDVNNFFSDAFVTSGG